MGVLLAPHHEVRRRAEADNDAGVQVGVRRPVYLMIAMRTHRDAIEPHATRLPSAIDTHTRYRINSKRVTHVLLQRASLLYVEYTLPELSTVHALARS